MYSLHQNLIVTCYQNSTIRQVGSKQFKIIAFKVDYLLDFVMKHFLKLAKLKINLTLQEGASGMDIKKGGGF